jgi:hypothetical protein
MPINPNIALGIQPVQQPNILGQMAQITAIRAAQQEMEGNEETRNFFAKPGGDPSKLLGTKQGREAYKTLNEGKIKQLEAEQKRIGLIGAAAGAVLQNPTMETFTSVVSNLVDRGIYTPEQRDQAFANIGNDPSKIKAFVTPIFNQAISAEKRLTDETSRRGQNLTYGASIRGQDLTDARMRAQQEFERNKRNVIAGEGEFLQTDAYGNVYRVEGFGPMRGPNALAPTAPPVANQSRINALTQPSAAVQPGLPTVANAMAIEAQNNVPRPKVPFTAPVPVLDENNRPVFVSGKEAIGKTPATPEALKLIREEKVTKEGKQSVNRVLGDLYSEYKNLVKSGGITDTRRSVEENISARTGASAAGQLVGGFTGSEAQSFRDTIEQTRPLLLTSIMKATGLSATQLNSNVELQTYLKTATDPKVSIQSNVKALNNISQMFGLGEKFEVPEIPKAAPSTAKSVDTPPAGLSPEIAGLWKYMTPEDRKLWQK